MEPKIDPGDVIQISPTANVNKALCGRLAFVDEVKSWGITAGVEDLNGSGVAYVRLEKGTFSYIGQPKWVPGWVGE